MLPADDLDIEVRPITLAEMGTQKCHRAGRNCARDGQVQRPRRSQGTHTLTKCLLGASQISQHVEKSQHVESLSASQRRAASQTATNGEESPCCQCPGKCSAWSFYDVCARSSMHGSVKNKPDSVPDSPAVNICPHQTEFTTAFDSVHPETLCTTSHTSLLTYSATFIVPRT